MLSLALSPKEKIIAAATAEDDIACLEVSAGEARWKLAGHDGGVNAVAFLGGNTLASAGEDGRVRTWNIAKQQEQQAHVVAEQGADRCSSGTGMGHRAAAAAAHAAFAVAASSPHCAHLHLARSLAARLQRACGHPERAAAGACQAAWPQRATARPAHSRQPLSPPRTPSGHTVSRLAATPDGKRFAAAAGSLVTLYTEGGAASRVLPPLPGTVESLKFDRHGNLLASYYGGVTYYDLRRSEKEGQVR